MKSIPKYILLLLCALPTVSCSSDDGTVKDGEKPTISLNYGQGFPQTCEELKKGQTYIFRAMATDNMALASYSLDIHHNFDHHTHDDQGEQCDLNPVKQAVDPMIFMENYPIENGAVSYEISLSITIPENIDTGDYHCSYSITDETGWQARTSVDIKIIE